MGLRLEVCVDTLAGLEAAVAGGADRIELCAALALGGLTPSAGLMREAAGCGLPVLAMIRPRTGDFCWSGAEVRAMEAEIAAAREAGLAWVVLGASLPDGRLDLPVLRRLVEVARGAGWCRFPHGNRTGAFEGSVPISSKKSVSGIRRRRRPQPPQHRHIQPPIRQAGPQHHPGQPRRADRRDLGFHHRDLGLGPDEIPRPGPDHRHDRHAASRRRPHHPDRGRQPPQCQRRTQFDPVRAAIHSSLQTGERVHADLEDQPHAAAPAIAAPRSPASAPHSAGTTSGALVLRRMRTRTASSR